MEGLFTIATRLIEMQSDIESLSQRFRVSKRSDVNGMRAIIIGLAGVRQHGGEKSHEKDS